MEYYLVNYSSIHSNIFYSFFSFLLVLEMLVPLKTVEATQYLTRWLNNIFLGFINIIFFKFLPLLSVYSISAWVIESQIGLFSYFSLPPFLNVIFSFLILDLSYYFLHRLFHTFPLFWRVHLTHHSDNNFDITTTVRHHPFEIILGILVMIGVVFIFGISLINIIIYELAKMLIDIFSHSNIKLNHKIEWLLRQIIITPYVHRIHHSALKSETNSNYGGVFIWWDYLFNTFQNKTEKDIKKIIIGLEYFNSDREQIIDKLLTQPFRKHDITKT